MDAKMKDTIDIDKLLISMEKYAATRYDSSYYQTTYELRKMRISEKIGELDTWNVWPILLFIRDWMPDGWKGWTKTNWKNMDSQLCNVLNSLSIEFHELSRLDLMNLQPAYNNSLKRVFEAISGLKLGAGEEAVATVTSKILHLLNSQLFVMWDTRIIDRYQCQPNAEGYLRFLYRMKQLAEELRPYLGRIMQKEEELRKRAATIYGMEMCLEKTLAKLVDEYNWIIGLQAERAVDFHRRCR
jgi:hypothetical protein